MSTFRFVLSFVFASLFLVHTQIQAEAGGQITVSSDPGFVGDGLITISNATTNGFQVDFDYILQEYPAYPVLFSPFFVITLTISDEANANAFLTPTTNFVNFVNIGQQTVTTTNFVASSIIGGFPGGNATGSSFITSFNPLADSVVSFVVDRADTAPIKSNVYMRIDVSIQTEILYTEYLVTGFDSTN